MVSGYQRVIDEHEAIWLEFHLPSGITLAQSKADWLALLDDDPHMTLRTYWGDLAGTTTQTERDVFKVWLSAEATS